MPPGSTITVRRYRPEDWLRIRQFLVDTYALYQRPFNWLIERWNFCRYFVLPVHTAYNLRYFGVPTNTAPPHRNELPFWERLVYVWENAKGDIVGVVHTENEEPGEAWIQIHPDYHHLYPEMIDVIESELTDWTGDTGFVKVYVDDHCALPQIVSQRGYTRLDDHAFVHAVYTIGATPDVLLPAGFAVKSVADEDDVDKRRIAKSMAFGHELNPSDWAPASVYREMQKAPDYRPELDLFIVAPNGEYAAFTTIWLDEANHYANFEPVGTHADYQRQGLGTALLHEGFRRMATYGATHSYMDYGNPFYRKVGFVPMPFGYCPWIKYLSR